MGLRSSHLDGKQHQQKIKWNMNSAMTAGNDSSKRVSPDAKMSSALDLVPSVEYKILKQKSTKDKNNPPKLAPIFRKTPQKKKTGKYDEIYRNIFHHKKDVNLYIRSNQVFWEFAYNPTIIQAVKMYIPGRQWNPSAKKWSCPLESLPEAIELYEYMGRVADDSLKQRAQQIVQTCHGAKPNEIISLTVYLHRQQQENENFSLPSAAEHCIGTVHVKFTYNPGIVQAIKNLPPTQRAYDPNTKVWPIDLLALPILLEHLQELEYTAASNPKSQALCVACNDVIQAMEQQQEQNYAMSKSPEAGDLSVTSDKNETSPIGLELDTEGSKTDEEPATTTKLTENSVTPNKSSAFLSSNAPLEIHVKALVSLFLQHQKEQDEEKYEHDFDRSDCGTSKRRRTALDSSTILYLRYHMEDGELESYLNCLIGQNQNKRQSHHDDCECGHPEKLSGGQHVCRYFGTFECVSCGNRWTSAYTWKGEIQACRRCNEENHPIRKDPLKSGKRVVSAGVGGHHDSARCTRCIKLGHPCHFY